MTSACNIGSPRTKAQSAERGEDEVAKRLECVELAPAVERRGSSKAGASSTHSKRFARFGCASMRAETRSRSVACFDKRPAPLRCSRSGHRTVRPRLRRRRHQGESHLPARLSRSQWLLPDTVFQFLDAALPE